MPRNYYEPLDPFDIFERQAAEEIAAKRAEERRQHELAEANDARLAAERKEEARQFSLRTNRRQLLGEYQFAGVKPPVVDENGFPTVSLSMLTMIGWTIEQVGQYRTLVAPAAVPRREPERQDQNT